MGMLVAASAGGRRLGAVLRLLQLQLP